MNLRRRDAVVTRLLMLMFYLYDVAVKRRFNLPPPNLSLTPTGANGPRVART